MIYFVEAPIPAHSIGAAITPSLASENSHANQQSNYGTESIHTTPPLSCPSIVSNPTQSVKQFLCQSRAERTSNRCVPTTCSTTLGFWVDFPDGYIPVYLLIPYLLSQAPFISLRPIRSGTYFGHAKELPVLMFLLVAPTVSLIRRMAMPIMLFFLKRIHRSA